MDRLLWYMWNSSLYPICFVCLCSIPQLFGLKTLYLLMSVHCRKWLFSTPTVDIMHASAGHLKWPCWLQLAYEQKGWHLPMAVADVYLLRQISFALGKCSAIVRWRAGRVWNVWVTGTRGWINKNIKLKTDNKCKTKLKNHSDNGNAVNQMIFKPFAKFVF